MTVRDFSFKTSKVEVQNPRAVDRYQYVGNLVLGWREKKEWHNFHYFFFVYYVILPMPIYDLTLT